MHRYLLAILYFLALAYATHGQEDGRVSISFDSSTLNEAILQLEDLAQIPFFFEDAWLQGHRVSKSFERASVDEVLRGILADTDLHYHRYDGRIILLKNTRVLTELSPDLFGETAGLKKRQAGPTPIFKEEVVSKAMRTQKTVVAIGKQNPGSKQGEYELSGLVTKVGSDEPVSELSLFTSDRSRYAVTDSTGSYAIMLPYGHHKLETQLLGYEKVQQEVIIYGPGELDLQVVEDVEVLDEIVVRSNRDANIADAAVGVSLVDVKAIKTIPLVMGERDILKVTTTLPGIKTAGEGSSGFNVRGGRADQNLVMLDGAPIYNPTHFWGIFSAINPFATQSLEVYKASIPASYGGRLSSVFDIKAKEGNRDATSGQGSIGPLTANLTLETPVVEGKSSIIAGIRSTYTDYILRSLKESALKNSEASFYDAIFKYVHEINDQNSVEGTFYYSKDRFSITTDSVFRYSNRLMSLRWRHRFSQRSWASLVVSGTQYKYNILFDADANTDFDFGYVLNERQLKVKFDQLWGQKHTLNYGFSSKLYVTEPGSIKPLNSESEVAIKEIDRERGLESALYLSDLFEVNHRLLLDLGLRYSYYASLGPATQNVYAVGVPRNEGSVVEVKTYDHNELIKNYGGFEYRLSGRYLFGQDWSVKAGCNRTVQYIHLLTTNTTMSPTDIWKLSDLNIKPQRAQQFSLGIFRNVPSKNLEISVEGYYKEMTDLLDYKIGAQLILNDALETELLQGEGQAYGVELLLKKTTGRLNGYVGYSYSRAQIKLNSTIREEQVNNGDFFPANFDKPHDFSLISNYRFTKRISASLNFIYQTGRPITYPVGKFVFAGQDRVLYSDRNQFRIPDYYRLDLGINIEGSHKREKLAHSFVNISVYNLLGRNNPYSVFFVNDRGRIKAYKTSIFAIPVPTLTYNFQF